MTNPQDAERAGWQVRGMPDAICHACGLGYKCKNPKCPNTKQEPDWLAAAPSPPASPPAVEELCARLDTFGAYKPIGGVEWLLCYDVRAALVSLSAQIETLKAERDEARAEWDWVQRFLAAAEIDPKNAEMLEHAKWVYRAVKAACDETLQERKHAARNAEARATAAEAERERLREALRKIADHDYTDADATLTEQPTFIWQTVARAALGETKGGGRS